MTVELGRLAEQHIFIANAIGGFYFSDASEPYDIHGALTIRKQPDETSLGTFALHIEVHKHALDLHHGHFARERRYFVNRGAVNVMRRKVIQQVLSLIHI